MGEIGNRRNDSGSSIGRSGHDPVSGSVLLIDRNSEGLQPLRCQVSDRGPFFHHAVKSSSHRLCPSGDFEKAREDSLGLQSVLDAVAHRLPNTLKFLVDNIFGVHCDLIRIRQLGDSHRMSFS